MGVEVSESSFSECCRIAVLVPCYNEATTIAAVVRDFRAALPDACVYVYDNASTDATAAIAGAAGATVRSVELRGKGNVVRRQFADIEAGIYLLVDGDTTYDAASAPAMIALLESDGLDMVTGVRAAETDDAFRSGHARANRALTAFLGGLFGRRCEDVLSGYRVFSRRFVKSFPSLSEGWEIELEFTVHALELRVPFGTIKTPYRARPQGSISKLNTWSDGARLGMTMVWLFQSERPLTFYGSLASLSAAASILLALPVFSTYVATGLVPRFPTAILATGLMILAALSLAVGLTLDTVTRGRRETKLLAYLQQPGPLHRP